MSNRVVATLSRQSLILSVLCIYLLMLMEWAFQVTKPSFFSLLPFAEALAVLWIAPLPLVLAAAMLAMTSRPLLHGARQLGARETRLAWIAASLPALFLAPLILLLVDNFSYTLMGVGISTLRSSWRLVYGGAFSLTTLLLIRALAGKLLEPQSHRPREVAVAALLATSTLALVLSLGLGESNRANWGTPNKGARLTDILLISGDGFETLDIPRYANSGMGLFRRLLGKNTITFENHFPNSSRTAGTVPAVLTGKNTASTGKISGTSFLSGRDAYEHLPGLLKSYGYQTIQIGDRQHVDSVFWGMQGAFDVYNDTQLDRNPLSGVLDRLSLGLGGRLDAEIRLPRTALDRIVERLRHIFGGELIVRPHRIWGKTERLKSQAMLASLDAFLDANRRPVFVQLHSMVTRTGGGTPAFVDLLQHIVRKLQEQGRFRDAMIVIWSDHGKNHTQNVRLPLIIKFPHEVRLPGAPANQEEPEVSDRRSNTQTLDIAPTVLAVLGIPVPDWMEGRALFGPRDPLEPIFSTFEGLGGKGLPRETERGIVKSAVRKIGLIVCQRWYALEVFQKSQFSSGYIAGHTAACGKNRLPNAAKARGMMLEHLEARGYGQGLAEAGGLPVE